jgi:hypothetical protein
VRKCYGPATCNVVFRRASARPCQRIIRRGLCQWKGISLSQEHTFGLVAVSNVLPVRRSFNGFAMSAAALLSMNARPASDTPFTFQFSNSIGSPLKLRLAGFPRSAPANGKRRMRRIGRTVLWADSSFLLSAKLQTTARIPICQPIDKSGGSCLLD